MSAADLLAGTVMDMAASLMNDPIKSQYTYAAQIPYLNMALQELQEYFELNSIPVTENTSAVITCPAGTSEIVYNGVGVPTLPSDMVEPQQLWERATGIDPYIPMTKRDYLPHGLEGIQNAQFIYFTWQDQKIKVLPATASNDIKIDYIKQLFTPVTSSGSLINVINAQSYLEYRTAALLAEFIERNKTSSDSMNSYAVLAMDRATGISSKGKQSIMTRRRPFRAGYKRRGWVG